MPDLLLVRIEALQRNLSRVHQEAHWKRGLAVATRLEDDNLWQTAFADIHPRAMAALRTLKTIVEGSRAGTLSPGDAWLQYHEVYGTTEDLFQECLQLQGGLAIRDRKLDERICDVADELMRDCADALNQRLALSIPWHDAPHTNHRVKNLSRIARVRFPEWEVWAVPLVAHEYGRVAIADHVTLRDYVASQAKAWCTPDDQAVSVLLADAFATYTTGPAYACALVLLRLSPFDSDARTRLFDCQRARTVLAVLDAMDRDGQYRGVRERLAEYWAGAISTTSAAVAARSSTDEFDLDMGGLIELFEENFRPVVSYSSSDWAVAMTWSTQWRGHADDGPLEVPGDLPVVCRQRDALNAAWHARMQQPELAHRLATVTGETCAQIMANRRGRATGGTGRIPPSGAR